MEYLVLEGAGGEGRDVRDAVGGGHSLVVIVELVEFFRMAGFLGGQEGQ